jgi:nicotinamide mononucleotide transporter
MNFFYIDHIFFQVLGYNMSYLEFFGVASGLVAIWLSAKANIWSWPIGVINVTLSFFLYYQVQLYPDMFLQVFFLVTNIMGWWRWLHPRAGEEDRNKELKVSFMKSRQLILLMIFGLVGTMALGSFAKNLHNLLPAVFPMPSAFPYFDSAIMVMSIITTFFMIQKKIESWIIWIIVDVIATYLYFIRDIKFYSLMYLLFCAIAAYGLWNWIREYKSYTTPMK